MIKALSQTQIRLALNIIEYLNLHLNDRVKTNKPKVSHRHVI